LSIEGATGPRGPKISVSSTNEREEFHMPKFPRDREQAIMTGRRVSKLMRERLVSIAALADSVRIQQSTLANYCAGRRIPSDLLVAIARTLQTNVAYLLAISDDPAPAPAVP
jgi:Cro/C1-type helix-turn-helix DNA-binding protein